MNVSSFIDTAKYLLDGKKIILNDKYY
jgi:hypothetical protein